MAYIKCVRVLVVAVEDGWRDSAANPIMAFKTPFLNGTKRLLSAYFVKPFYGGNKRRKGIFFSFLIRFNFAFWGFFLLFCVVSSSVSDKIKNFLKVLLTEIFHRMKRGFMS